MALTFRFAAHSDVGLLRDGNEDSAYAGSRLLVVADGMGGHAAGEVASAVAVATIASLDEDAPGPDLLDQLRRAVHAANETLRDMVARDGRLRGMGTTLTAILRSGARIGLAHIGDSRCYLLRDGELRQLTHDHTFVQSLVDDGRITEEEADHHPQRALILRALDGRGEAEPDLSVREARPGDRYLLCSDGLSGVVSRDTLAATLVAHRDPAQACEELVELALRGGGPDNITCIVADVVDVSSASSPVPQVVGAAAEGHGGPETSLRARLSGSAAAKAAALRPKQATPAQPTSDPGARRPAGDRATRGRPLRRILLLAGCLAVLATVTVGAYAWSQRQYYVAADHDRVAIFRGVSGTVAGHRLSDVYERKDVALAALPTYTRERVAEAIPADDLPHARRIVTSLAMQAANCATVPTTPTPSATAAASPARTGPATPRPRAGRTPAKTATPTPTKTATATKTPGATASPTRGPAVPPRGCEGVGG